MPLDIAHYERKAHAAVKAFWGNRATAAQKQRELGRPDHGERAQLQAQAHLDFEAGHALAGPRGRDTGFQATRGVGATGRRPSPAMRRPDNAPWYEATTRMPTTNG